MISTRVYDQQPPTKSEQRVKVFAIFRFYATRVVLSGGKRTTVAVAVNVIRDRPARV